MKLTNQEKNVMRKIASKGGQTIFKKIGKKGMSELGKRGGRPKGYSPKNKNK